jgi:hypothetical protein
VLYVLVRRDDKKEEIQPPPLGPCTHGDDFPFDECGKDPNKILPLASFPRPIRYSPGGSPADLRAMDDLVEKLAGEWIGLLREEIWTYPFLAEEANKSNTRIHWRFEKDSTFQASVFRYDEFKRKQYYALITGTFSQQDGKLFIDTSDADSLELFLYLCKDKSGRVRHSNSTALIPIGLWKNGQSLTIHSDDEDGHIINVLIRK